MTSIYDTFEATQETAVIDYGDAGSIEIKRTGSSNTAYTKLLAARLKPHRHKIQNGLVDPKVIRRIMIEVYAETVIVGWKGIKDRNGKNLSFNKDNCVKLLLDLDKVFDDIQDQADNVANFRKEEIEETAKNSQES